MSVLRKISVTLVLLPVLKKTIEVFNQQFLPPGKRYPALSFLLLATKGVVYLRHVLMHPRRAFLRSIAEFTRVPLHCSRLLIVMMPDLQGMAEEGQTLRLKPMRGSTIGIPLQRCHGEDLFRMVLMVFISRGGRAVFGIGRQLLLVTLTGCTMRQILDDGEAVVVIESQEVGFEVHSEFREWRLLQERQRLSHLGGNVGAGGGSFPQGSFHRLSLHIHQENLRGLVPGVCGRVLRDAFPCEKEGVGGGEETAHAAARGGLEALLHRHTILFYSTSVQIKDPRAAIIGTKGRDCKGWERTGGGWIMDEFWDWIFCGDLNRLIIQ